MNTKEKVKRYIIFFVGLVINSFGISFITKANLGTSPISSVPYTLSLAFAPSLGIFTLYMSIVLILLQLILLQKKFPKEYFLQIPISLLFSVFIDCSMRLLKHMSPQSYVMKIVMLLIGCMILGFGVYLEMVANVVMLPGESFVNAVSKTFHTDFGKTKVAFDSTMTVMAAVLGFIMIHKLAGVREGTVIAAFFVGMTARLLKRKLIFVEERVLPGENSSAIVQPTENMVPERKLVITISREYGSGGRMIAKRIAEEFHMQFYDREIITMTANEMNMDEFEIESKEQKLTNSFLYDLVAQFYDLSEQEAMQDKLYKTESKVVRKFAAEGNCVIVGRCADYICKDMENVYNIFLYADKEHKIQEIMKREALSYESAQKHVREINKKRFQHYKYYTDRIWGMAGNYNLCIDTGKVSTDSIIKMIKDAML